MGKFDHIEDPVQKRLYCFCDNIEAYLECSIIAKWPQWLQFDLAALLRAIPEFRSFEGHWSNYQGNKDTLHPFLEEIKASFTIIPRMGDEPCSAS